jgi:hypothetical protein
MRVLCVSVLSKSAGMPPLMTGLWLKVTFVPRGAGVGLRRDPFPVIAVGHADAAVPPTVG